MTMKLQLVFPELRLTGQYKLNGKIFSLVMEGLGPFWAILSWSLRLIHNSKLYSNFISNLMYRLGNVTIDFNQPLVVKERAKHACGLWKNANSLKQVIYCALLLKFIVF